MKQSLISKVALVAALGTAITATAALAEKTEKEKCYGVVKAGKNDCGNSTGTHSCAGQAKTDADATEWVLVPKGLCEKLAGGTTEPKS